MRRILLIASLVPLFLTCIPARAQNQSKFAAEFSDESAGSIAPQNGFGFGPAFVYGTNFQNGWRVRWSLDGVRSTNGSWRAGLYFQGISFAKRPQHCDPADLFWICAGHLTKSDRFFRLREFHVNERPVIFRHARDHSRSKHPLSHFPEKQAALGSVWRSEWPPGATSGPQWAVQLIY